VAVELIDVMLSIGIRWDGMPPATMSREPVASMPSYIVVVQTAVDLEDLRLMAYDAANKVRGGSTEHWDEERPSGTAFCFVNWEAAFLFTVHCARASIPYRSGE
jgi:hypothetical protein